MPPVTANDLRKERVVSRQYRNRRVGDFLKELDLTEGRNTGFPKIYSSLRKNGSPMPLFETDDTNSFFRATLPIHKAFVGAGGRITGHGKPLNEPLNEPLKGVVLQVYQMIVARPGIKKVEIADNVNKSYASVKRYVKVLEDADLVEYRDSKKTGGLYPVKK